MKTQQTTISEVSLIYRSKVKASDRPQVKCSKDAYNLFMEHWDHDTIVHVEEFKVMLMNRSNVVLGIMDVAKGGISCTVTDVRILLQASILREISNYYVSLATEGNMRESKIY
jgi:DNA repair protein RadC